MNPNKQHLDQWTKGIVYEVAFWNNVCRWDRTFQSTMQWSHLGGPISLEGFNAQDFLVAQPHPVVLDVGCGMSYATGNFIERDGMLTPIEIHYVDPLAAYFNQIAQRHHRQLPEVEFGMMEHLSAFFPQQDVSMVVIQNALDHSANPIKGIIEALHTVRTGGVVYLNHHPNEAETEQYKGFHQYNICLEDQQLVIWNKQERQVINDIISDFATINVWQQSDTRHVIAVIRKTADIPQDLLTAKLEIQELCKNVMSIQALSQNVGRTLRQQFRYWLFNCIQFFAQSLTYENKMRLKQLIKQR